jgi:hypothetical protein
MGIVFFCQSCGARFEVDPRMAGKKGRCKQCGQNMAIPRAEEIASMAAMPALALAGAGAGVAPGPAAGTGGASTGSWPKGGASKIALAPITLDRMPIGQRRPTRPSPLDDAQDSKPYALAQPVRQKRGRVHVQDNVVLRFWRRQLGGIQKLFRKINQAAYLVSVPFLMILILGVVVGHRPTALFGATVVVLLNVGRLAAGAANLAVVPFRDGINFQKMKKPLGRVIEPVITIGLVVVAFRFIPWLSSGQPAEGSITDQIRSEARSLRKEMKGEVDKVVDVDKLGAQAQKTLEDLGDKAKDFDVKKLGAQAQETLKGLGDKAQESLKGLRSPSSGGPPKESSSGLRGTIKALEKRTQEELDKAKALGEPRQQP